MASASGCVLPDSAEPVKRDGGYKDNLRGMREIPSREQRGCTLLGYHGQFGDVLAGRELYKIAQGDDVRKSGRAESRVKP